jgi:hypothetical protein
VSVILTERETGHVQLSIVGQLVVAFRDAFDTIKEPGVRARFSIL